MLLKSFVYYITFLISIFKVCFSLDVSQEADALKVWNSFMKTIPLLSMINSAEFFIQRQDVVNHVIADVMLEDSEESPSKHSVVYKYLYDLSPMVANVYKSYYDLDMPLILNKSPYKSPQFILNGESFPLDEIYYLKSDKLVPNAEHYNTIDSQQPIIGSIERLIKNPEEVKIQNKDQVYANYINTEKPLVQLHCDLNEEFFELFLMEAFEGKFNLVWYDTSNITFYDPKNTAADDLHELKFDTVKGLTLNNTGIVTDMTFTDKQRKNKKGFLSNLDNILTLNAINYHTDDPWDTIEFIFNSTNNLPFNDYQQKLLRDFNVNKKDVLSKKEDIIQKDMNLLKQNGITYENLGLYVNGMNILHHHASQMGVLDTIVNELKVMNGLKNSISSVFPLLTGQMSIEKIKKLLLEYEVMYSRLAMFNQPRKFDVQNTEDNESVVLFVNDLENDFQYKDLNTDIHKFMSSSHEKEFPEMKENWNDIIFLLDLNDASMMRDFIRVITVVSDGFPQRIGFIPLTDDLKMLNKILQVYKNPIKLANVLKDPSVRKAKDKYETQAEELQTNIAKFLEDMNITENEGLIVNGEIFPFRDNTWNYFITSVMNKDIQFMKTYFQNMEHRGEATDTDSLKLRDILFSESLAFVERDLTLTPDYFGDTTTTRTNYEYVLELRDLGHEFEYTKDKQYEIIHVITYVADFSNVNEWRNVYNLLQNNLFGVKIRFITLGDPNNEKWFSLQDLVNEDPEDFLSYIEEHESDKETKTKPLLETVDLGNWLLDLSYKQLQSQRFIVMNGRFVDLTSFDMSKGISTQSWFNFIKFESFKTLQGLTAMDITFELEANNIIPMRTFEDIISHLTYFSHRELTQGKENYEQGVHYTAETVQTRHPINQVLLHIEADKNMETFLGSKNFKKDSMTKPVDLVLFIDPIEERSNKFIEIVRNLKPLKKYLNFQIVLLPTNKLTVFPRQTIFGKKNELESMVGDSLDFEINKVPVYKKLENHKLESRNDTEILADLYVQKTIKSIKGCTRTTVETNMNNICMSVVVDDDSAEEICRVSTMSTFGFAQIRIPVTETRRLKVVSCDPRYDIIEMSLDMNSDFTAWENFQVRDLLKRSVLVHVEEREDVGEITTYDQLSVLSIVQNKQDLAKLSDVLINKSNKYFIWNAESSGLSKQEILQSLPSDYDITVINVNWADWMRPNNLISHQMKFAKYMLLDVNLPLEVNELIHIDLTKPIDEKWIRILKAGSLGNSMGTEDIIALEQYGEDDTVDKYWKTEEYWTNFMETNDLDKFYKTDNYIVRLNDFRENHYGDILRVHYQKLSTDVNSLGRYDESLMNNAQALLSLSTIKATNEVEIDLDEL